MDLQVLVSTMHQKDYSLLQKMNIQSDAIVINQGDSSGIYEFENQKSQIKWVDTTERGLSRSRNEALRKATKEICLLSDDDLEYVPHYKEIITEAFINNPKADIIVFQVEGIERRFKKYTPKKRNIGFLNAMKISSVEIAFKLQSIRDKNLDFDELFGAGAKYPMGEENIFLSEALKCGLKIVYVPAKIANLHMGNSCWFKGFNKEYLMSRGAGFAAMSNKMGYLLIVQFALRKYKLFKDNYSLREVFVFMFEGRRRYLKDKKKVYFVGDFKSHTGPAIANKILIRGLKHEQAIYSVYDNLFLRFIEYLFKMTISTSVCFCSYSRFNLIGIKIAKLMKKEIFYLMHGYKTYEYQINSKSVDIQEKNKINEFEKYIFKNSKKVFCVSKRFMKYMKEAEPDYADKFDYNYNGIDFEKIERYKQEVTADKKKNNIISLGGGMPQKNNLEICKAIDIINKEKNFNLEYIIIGKEYFIKSELEKYKFVKFYESKSHNEVIKLMAESFLYIQNSSLETFGISIIEALYSNCNMLISNHIGVLDVLEAIREEDVIFDINNTNEIARKIENIYSEENADRLYQGLQKSKIYYKHTAESLYKKICME